jgi:hypothetical protein
MEPRKPCRVARLEVCLLEGRIVPGGLTIISREVLSSDSYIRGGRAIERNHVVTVTVNKPTLNVVHVQEPRAGHILVNWNGGAKHAFDNVHEVVVRTVRGPIDVTLNGHSASHVVHGSVTLPVQG